jgi:hypothetical protein
MRSENETLHLALIQELRATRCFSNTYLIYGSRCLFNMGPTRQGSLGTRQVMTDFPDGNQRHHPEVSKITIVDGFPMRGVCEQLLQFLRCL